MSPMARPKAIEASQRYKGATDHDLAEAIDKIDAEIAVLEERRQRFRNEQRRRNNERNQATVDAIRR